MPVRIDINGLKIKEAYAGVRITNKDGTSIRITNTQEPDEFEVFCEVRQPDGAILTGGNTFRIINGKVKEEL